MALVSSGRTWPFPQKRQKVASLSKLLLYLFMLTQVLLPPRFRKLLLALCFHSKFKTKVRIMYSIESNHLFFFLDITMFLGQKSYLFLLSLQIIFYNVARPFFLAQGPPFCKAITISNSVSQSSVNLDCSEIDSPYEHIRFE